MAQRRKRDAGVVVIVGFCVIAFTLDLLISSVQPYYSTEDITDRSSPRLRRSLSTLSNQWADYQNRPAVNPIARHHVKPLGRSPTPSKETVLFWHIAKTGGTTVKEIYKCMNQTLAVRVGADPRFGHDKDTELIAFEAGNTGATFVNVDTLSKPGILRAKELGLVPSGLADMIVTGNLNFALEHLYDAEHKGRVLCMFRHPVERLISKFYYTQIATWERSYHPQWKDMSLEHWARHVNSDNDHMVKTLAGKRVNDKVTEADLRIAVRTVRQRFIVGLTTDMEESIHRFNIFMGIDESENLNNQCMDKFFGHGVKKSNSNSHAKVDEGSPAWEVLAQDNSFDVRLYEEVVKTFHDQTEVIRSYASASAVWNGLE